MLYVFLCCLSEDSVCICRCSLLGIVVHRAVSAHIRALSKEAEEIRIVSLGCPKALESVEMNVI